MSWFRLFAAAAALAALAPAADRPNILWITLEDLSPELGAYGFEYAVTPNMDRFAAQSVRYDRAFSNGGACAPARSTLITGMYPPGIGTSHMRSEGRPPAFVRGFTEWLREAGYYTSNHAKTDYNWIPPRPIWDSNSPNWRDEGWRKRDAKPFFTVINIMETHSSQTYHPWAPWQRNRDALSPEQRHDPAEAVVPPFYPDTPETREILRRYADNVTYADGLVGEVLDALEADGLTDSTIVFLYADHGTGLPRSKSFLFESSLRVPLLIRFPAAFSDLAPSRAGGSVSRIVSFVDFAPTVLSLAGVEIPEHFQGQAFLGDQAGGFPPAFTYGYRDRMDERYEFIRSVRDGRFKYIRNFFPHLPWFHEQTRIYPSTNPLLETWHKLAAAGELTGGPAVYMARSKPREQLFDLREDPDELHNLADDERYQGVLKKMRGALRSWMYEIRDLGFLPEGEMWRAFDGRAYDAVRADPDAYPLERVFETADWVGLGPNHLERQVERLKDPSATVRFWAALGLAALGERAAPAREALGGALDDESPDVRVVAAQALCGAGDCERALEVLVEQMERGDEYVSLRAVNALYQLGPRARPVKAALEAHSAPLQGLDLRDFFREATYSQRAAFTAARALE